jgi:uncharacterized protein YlaI
LVHFFECCFLCSECNQRIRIDAVKRHKAVHVAAAVPHG